MHKTFNFYWFSQQKTPPIPHAAMHETPVWGQRNVHLIIEKILTRRIPYDFFHTERRPFTLG